MRIIYTSHARQRMEEREITEREIEECILFPQGEYIDHDVRITKRIRTVPFHGKRHLLIVCSRNEGEKVRIITVIDTSKIEKYL